MIQTSLPLPKLSPSTGNSPGRGRGRYDKLHLPTKNKNKEEIRKKRQQSLRSRCVQIHTSFARLKSAIISPWPRAWSLCLRHCTQPQSGRPSSWPCASHDTQSLLDWQSAPSLSFPPLQKDTDTLTMNNGLQFYFTAVNTSLTNSKHFIGLADTTVQGLKKTDVLHADQTKLCCNGLIHSANQILQITHQSDN